jgi:hypothetical protein
MEHEAVVVSLRSREALRVHHELERFNPVTCRGDARFGWHGRPYSETNRDQSGGNGAKGGCVLSFHDNPPNRPPNPTSGALEIMLRSRACEYEVAHIIS